MAKMKTYCERMMKARQIIESVRERMDLTKFVGGLIENTYLVKEDSKTSTFYIGDEVEIFLIEGDSLDGIIFAHEEQEKEEPGSGLEPIVVNYANYQYPGGGFLRGAYAQEEFLCHHSLLYPALAAYDRSWYKQHRNDSNGYLFRNEALVTSNVPFSRNIDDFCNGINHEKVTFADVLTIAAPINKDNDTPEKMKANKDAFRSRIEFMFRAAADIVDAFGDDSLVTGPFGCGAFKQNPHFCAEVMKCCIEGEYKNAFRRIVFAIPDRNSENYKAFKEAFPNAKEILKEEG